MKKLLILTTFLFTAFLSGKASAALLTTGDFSHLDIEVRNEVKLLNNRTTRADIGVCRGGVTNRQLCAQIYGASIKYVTLIDFGVSYEVQPIYNSSGNVVDYNYIDLWGAKDAFFYILGNKLRTSIANDPDAYIDFNPALENNIMLNRVGDSIALNLPSSLGSYTSVNKSISVLLNSSSQQYCGSGWNQAIVPEQPFHSACEIHDYCYASSNPKSFCDEEFLRNMINISLNRVNSETDDWKSLVKLTAYLAMAQLYYEAVDNYGLGAWCKATTSSQKQDCANLGSGGGIIRDPNAGTGRYKSYNGMLVCAEWVEVKNTTSDGLYCTRYRYEP
ncbi:hypothetical protein [Rheinheimera sp.]|uniref:hypothetical protein n=1 Tax=Rheinheimera sp. TaxID=1869214 RepID=UPI00307E2303